MDDLDYWPDPWEQEEEDALGIVAPEIERGLGGLSPSDMQRLGFASELEFWKLIAEVNATDDFLEWYYNDQTKDGLVQLIRRQKEEAGLPWR